MSLRNQPYFPLYVQDFLTDEKLIECSAQATGVYIRILCIMHKEKEYGKILLKQKDKQTKKQIKNFALKLLKYLPYDLVIIEDSLQELIAEDVLQIEGDYLLQKRMIKDNQLSIKRSEAGRKGGLKTFAQAKYQANNKAKVKANSEYENENEIEYENNKKELNENQKKVAAKIFDYLGLKYQVDSRLVMPTQFENHRNVERFLELYGDSDENLKYIEQQIAMYKRYCSDFNYPSVTKMESFLGYPDNFKGVLTQCNWRDMYNKKNNQ